MADPTPDLTLSAELVTAGTSLIAAAGALREGFMRNNAPRPSQLSEIHRALTNSAAAMHAYEMAQIDALRERNGKLLEMVR